MKMSFRPLFAAALLLTCSAGFAADAAGAKAAAAPAAKAVPVTPRAEIAKLQALVPEDALIAGYTDGGAILRSKLFGDFIKMLGEEMEGLTALVHDDGDGWCVFYLRNFDAAAQKCSFGGAAITAKPQPDALDKAVARLNDAAKESGSPLQFKKCKAGDYDAVTVDFKDAKDSGKKVSFCMIKISDTLFQFCGELNPEKPFAPALLKARGEIAPVAQLLDTGAAFSISVNITEAGKLTPQLQEGDADPFVGKIQNIEVAVKEEGDSLLVSGIIAALPDAIVPLKAMIAQSVDEMKENPLFGPIAETVKVSDQDSKILISGRLPSALLLGMVQSSFEQAKESAPAAAGPAPAAKNVKKAKKTKESAPAAAGPAPAAEKGKKAKAQ